MKRIAPVTLAALVLAGIAPLALLPSCATHTQTGTLLGAATGAALGAAIDDDNRGRGAIIGGAIGTAVGGVAGAVADANAQRYEPPPNYGAGDYPYGTPTNDPTLVRSPYAPNNVINVSGFRRGEVVLDPTTNRPFRIP